MIVGEIPLERIFESNSEVKRDNIIKLLLRCKKMYEDRVEVRTIIILLIAKQVMQILFNLITGCFQRDS